MKKAMVIFGSTGNLMYKKLIPALDKLMQKRLIDEEFKIFAVARRDYSLDEYIMEAKKNVKDFIHWDRLVKHLEYIKFDVSNIEDYKSLKSKIEISAFNDVSFYLAVPPTLFPVISKGVSDSNLIIKGDHEKRIVFEKPFGENLQSAKEINKELWKYFDEEQIYRIDHYLGKEMIQNILIVRFTNIIFEKAWNNNFIRSISIISKEEEGVMSRGGYYDEIGALKDMLQSHLLQMASLVLMDKPSDFSSQAIKDEKIKVLNQMKISANDLVLGQYEGYLKADKVNQRSKTETFIYAKSFVDNDRWKGIPIHFLTGKKLDEKRSEIIIHFNDGSDLGNFFPQAKKQENKLIIKVSPKEGVEFQFNVKEPGLSNNIEIASLDYCHNCKSVGNTPEAYEKLLLELLNQQKTLFTRWDEIESTWALVEGLKSEKVIPYKYKSYQDILDILSKKGVKINDL